MAKDEENVSEDQPTVSEDDQQEETSEESEVSEEESTEDQPEVSEEEEEEDGDEYVEIDGELVLASEVFDSHRNKEKWQKENTVRAQELGDKERQLAQAIQSMNEPGNNIDNKDKAVIDKLKALGVLTSKEVEDMVKRIVSTTAIANQAEDVKAKYGLDEPMLDAVYAYSNAANVSLEEAAKVFSKPKRVVKKKILGFKKGKSVPSSTPKGDNDIGDKESALKTLQLLKKKGLKDPKDMKKFDTIRAAMEQGKFN